MRRKWGWSRRARLGLPVILVLVLAGASGTAIAANGASGAHSTAGAASAAAVRPAQACPQAPGDTCCGPIVAGNPETCCTDAGACCAAGTTTCCPASGCSAVTVSIRVTPDPVAEGRSVVIAGGTTGANGATATLWQVLPGAAAKDIGSTTTSSTGAYSFTRPRGNVTTDRTFYVTVGDARSVSVAESVTAKVTLSRARGTVRVGRRVVLHGTVAPSHHGETVLLQRRSGGHWRTLRRTRLGARSRVSVKLTFTREGSVRLRLVLPADSRNAKSSSHALAFSVAGA